MIGVLDLFRVGIGPSSSHTVGPMRAARSFADELADLGLLSDVARVTVDLHGSLGSTGPGHGTPAAVLAGLAGAEPETVDPTEVAAAVAACRERGGVRLLGRHHVGLDPDADVRLDPTPLPRHPNGIRLTALAADGTVLLAVTSYSIGGGFVLDDRAEDTDAAEAVAATPVPHPFTSGDELIARCETAGLSVSELMRADELVRRTADELEAGIRRVHDAMRACIDRGLTTDGILPGVLRVRRRAAELHRRWEAAPHDDPMRLVDRASIVAMAVNEENAAGGRVVTAPTNGAAGIVPAVIDHHLLVDPGAGEASVARFLLAAAAVGSLIKRNASISGADVGCQGEVGAACAMAAAGLAEARGGTPRQVENAAEIALEHNLGLTCDPIAGLVQIPCIERNGVAAVKAITAARIALQGDGEHRVSLDQAIRTLRTTGADMMDAYKETSRGGLAVNVIEC
jgi:L-serine dehydratase